MAIFNSYVSLPEGNNPGHCKSPGYAGYPIDKWLN